MTANRMGETARVVAAVDGSESARQAALWAAREAEVRDLPLTVLHAYGTTSGAPAPAGNVAQQGPRQAEGRTFVESVAAQIRDQCPGLHVDTELCPRAPVDRLVELSGQGALIVTGTRGHGGLAGVLFSSVSRALAAHAHGPLVVVRGCAQEDEGAVVLGVGLDREPAVVEYAFAAAQRYGASLHAVRARAPLPADVETAALMPSGLGLRSMVPPKASAYRQSERDQAIAREEAEVCQAIEGVRDRYPGMHVDVSTLEGEAAEVLIVEAHRARLVVIGIPQHPHKPFPAGPGHVAGRLLSRCPAPVAMVPDARG